MIRSLVSLCLIFLLPTLLVGQGRHRDKSLGKIEAVGKQDWKGAEVFFFSRPYTGSFVVGEPDLVRVIAGGKGRFQAKLLRGRLYDAWAILKKKEGRYLVTNTASKIVAGKLVQLKASKVEQMELRLRLLGQKRWPDRGPFSIQVLAHNKQAMSVDVAFDEKGEALLPPLPKGSASVLITAANGQRLLSKTVQLHSSARKGIHNQIKSYRKQYAKARKKREEDARRKAEEEAGKSVKKEENASKVKTTKATRKSEHRDKENVREEDADELDSREATLNPGDIVPQVTIQEGQAKGKKKKPVTIPQERLPEYFEGDIPGPDVELLVLPRTFKARFLLQDEAERPLAGIEVRHEIGDGRLGRMPLLGKTDEKGRIDLVVPQPDSGDGIPTAKPNLNFLFSGADWGRAQGGWTSYLRGQKKPMTNEEVVARESQIRKVVLSSGFSIKGHVFWRKNEPAVGFPVVVSMPAMISYGPGSFGTSAHRTFIIHTDRKGEFSVPGWHQRLYGGNLGLWVEGKNLVKQFSLDMEIPDSLIRPFPALNLWGQSEELELDAVYLSQMRVAQVEVRTGKGEQASFAAVAASLSQTMDWNRLDQDPANFRVADRRGRAVILVPGSQRNLFVRLEGEGYFFGGMQIPEGKISMPLKVFPRLQPFSKITGRVVDEKGKPIANADLSVRSSSMNGVGADVNMIYSLNWRLLRGKSDPQGYFALEFIPHPNISFGVGVRARVESQYYDAPEMIQVGTQSQSGLEIELPVDLELAKKEAREKAEASTKKAVKKAGNAVRDAVGGAGAGIENSLQGLLKRAKALAKKRKVEEAARKAKKKTPEKSQKLQGAGEKSGKKKTSVARKGKTEKQAKPAAPKVLDKRH